LDLLACLENEANKDFEDAKRKYEADLLVHKLKLKNAENAISDAIKSE